MLNANAKEQVSTKNMEDNKVLPQNSVINHLL